MCQGRRPPGGLKVRAFDALLMAERLCDTWRALYTTVADSRDKLLQENLLLSEKAVKAKYGGTSSPEGSGRTPG